MEKLVELLNEMIKSKGNCYKIIDYTGGVFIIDDKANKYRCNLYPAVVISKEYGFIKRLVKSDKINLKYVTSYSIYGADEYFTPYENLLMDLAKADDPIEYLCGLLK